VLLRSTIVAALGGLLFGFDTAVIAGATQALTQVYHLNPKTPNSMWNSESICIG